jgi:hypothetical protein
MTLKKDGAVIDQGIGQEPTENTEESKAKAVYFKKKTILGDSDALLFTVYISDIFSGATTDNVQFQYAWLIDETSAKEIKSGDQFGVFEVRTTAPVISMSNENTVSLSRNSETTLWGDLKFIIADNDTLRFYPKVDYVIETPTPTPTLVDSYLPPGATPAERKAGLIRAMDDYFDNGALTKPELLTVLDAYFA